MENFGDFTIVIGGDGTLLKAARFYAKQLLDIYGFSDDFQIQVERG